MLSEELRAIIEEHFKPIFDSYDKDKNSFLDKEELRVLLADGLGVQPADISQDQLDWHFEKIDENSDGMITFSEYVSFLGKFSSDIFSVIVLKKP